MTLTWQPWARSRRPSPPDGATIRDALATLEISGLITGDLKFDENGDAIKNYAVIKTIENGEIVYFSTFNGLE